MAGETTTPTREGADRGIVRRLRDSLEGPQTLGNSRWFWGAFLVLLGVLFARPFFTTSFIISNEAQLLLSAFLGLSLSLVWGYTGIFSFGQVAFYGIAGYTYGVVAINFPTPLPIIAGAGIAILLAALSALALGYFMFYGDIRDVFVAIITLVATLVLNTFMGQTAGSEWTIGTAALGGANGMTPIPSLAIGVGDSAVRLTDASFYWTVLILLVLVYLGMRWLVNSDYGYTMVAIRENTDRAEMLGYNTKFMKLLVFTLGGALAGLSGVLYAAWGNFISPSVFGIAFAAQPIIWVATGGRKWLAGAIIGTYFLTTIDQQLSLYGGQWAIVIQGSILLFIIMLLPEGFVPRLYEWIPELIGRVRNRGGESEA